MENFEAVFEAYHKDIYCFLLKLTGCQPNLAEELLQESFYQAFQSFDRFRGDCSIKTWLCQIAKNTYYRYLREQKRQRSLTEKYTENRTPENPEHLYEKKEMYLHLRRIIDGLDERTKTIVEYRLFSDIPFKEIAGLLNINEVTAKVTFSRAKVKIQEKLKEDYGYEI